MANQLKILGIPHDLPTGSTGLEVPIPQRSNLYRIENHTNAWVDLKLYDSSDLATPYAQMGIPPAGSENVQVKNPTTHMSASHGSEGDIKVIPLAFTQ